MHLEMTLHNAGAGVIAHPAHPHVMAGSQSGVHLDIRDASVANNFLMMAEAASIVRNSLG
jgi:hypothetical protein